MTSDDSSGRQESFDHEQKTLENNATVNCACQRTTLRYFFSRGSCQTMSSNNIIVRKLKENELHTRYGKYPRHGRMFTIKKMIPSEQFKQFSVD